jgi:hypothetical protein
VSQKLRQCELEDVPTYAVDVTGALAPQPWQGLTYLSSVPSGSLPLLHLVLLVNRVLLGFDTCRSTAETVEARIIRK